MNYLVELIKKKEPEIPEKKLEYIISYLVSEGHISYTIQYHYDIFEFYQKSLEHYTQLGLQKKCAFIDTLDHFKISKPHLYRIINNFSHNSETQ